LNPLLLDIEASIYFVVQYIIFSGIIFYLKKTNLEIIILSFPVLVVYILLILLPIDRSLTVEMLTFYINNDPTVLNDLYSFEKLSQKYLIEKRLDEQFASGLIDIKDDKIILNGKSRLLGNVYVLLSNFYLK
jgi:hypothetical protein